MDRLSHNKLQLEKRAEKFASEVIAKKGEAILSDSFPLDIWQKLGEEGFLGIGLPKKFGGLGEDSLSITFVGRALTAYGNNLGISLSWMIHNALARYFVFKFGKPKQRKTILPLLSSGTNTVVFAVSEPKTGGHPKYLKTTALRHGLEYVINGEKTLLTNGPIADLFIVIAVTSQEKEKKSFTAFLVPKDIKGLTITEFIKFDALKPAPHCGIRLENCIIPAENIIGKKDCAYELMVKPFRDIEDTLMMGPIAGIISAQLKMAVSILLNTSKEVSDKLMEDLGTLQSQIHTLTLLAYESAKIIDNKWVHPETLTFPFTFRWLASNAQTMIDELLFQQEVNVPLLMKALSKDVHTILKIAENVRQIKLRQQGVKLFKSMLI
ncbi:MAG: acyl-CoA/acyl-ACP dehydrogenase [Desulfobacterales bacterium]|nr:acyl-CoA/acyl-ACP dehydrogenase [Desulfobacterales bacterium]